MFILIHYAIFYGLLIAKELISIAPIDQHNGALVYVLLALLLAVINFLSSAYIPATLIPYIAVRIRRMHDTGRSGWWSIVPIANLIFELQDSQPNSNRYGDNPKQRRNHI